MQWGRQFRRVLRSTVVVIGGLVALLIVGTALFANSLAPNPPDEQNFDLVESAPGAKALFGTVMRGPVLAEREKDYVQAVRALGATRLAVALKHILPNVISPFVVQGTIAFSQAILIEASLSYLGLSAQPPTPSWGNMLNEGRTYLETAPWISVFPGIAIMLSVLAFNLIGDGLRDILDPNVQ